MSVSPLPFDHFLVFLCSVAFPAYGALTYPRWVREVDERGEPARVAGYRETILSTLVMALGVLGIWLWTGREWSALGFTFELHRGFWGSLILAAAVLGFTRLQGLAIEQGKVSADYVAQRMESVRTLMAQTPRERRWYRLTAINAGVTEEILYRAFLLWYFQTYWGLWIAAAATVVAFTLAHSYQGLSNVPELLAASALFVALYIWSGSIWIPMALHIAVDLLQGKQISRFFAEAGPAQLEQEPDPAA